MLTKPILEQLKNKVDSAHVDYVLADDTETFDNLVLAVNELYAALLDEQADKYSKALSGKFTPLDVIKKELEQK